MGTKGHHHPHDHDHDHKHDHHKHKHAHHDHGHHHHAVTIPNDDPGAVRRIKVAFYLNMTFALIELVGGIIIGSYAIVADAIHDFGDSLSLALALYLQKKSSLGPTKSLTYGYQRYSILSSLLSGTIIVAGSFVIVVESLTHLAQSEQMPNIPGMIGLSVIGILVNGAAAFGLSHGHSHNEKILSWHLIEDLLGWVAVLVGAICIKVFEVAWIDRLLAIGIAIFVLINVLKNMKGPLRIILQHVPDETELEALKHDWEHIPGVVGLGAVHAWTLDGTQHVVSAHLRISSWDQATAIRTEVRRLAEARGYQYINVDLEPAT